MQTVQLAIADAGYETALREALIRSGPWTVTSVAAPDTSQKAVLVIDEDAFNMLPLPVPAPERVVLITRKNPHSLSKAWDAGIVSVVSVDDPPNTILLAIMAAALRVPKSPNFDTHRGVSPMAAVQAASLPPIFSHSAPKKLKGQ
jgi:hypothetical protein